MSAISFQPQITRILPNKKAGRKILPAAQNIFLDPPGA
jgi:hypothetical protein